MISDADAKPPRLSGPAGGTITIWPACPGRPTWTLATHVPLADPLRRDFGRADADALVAGWGPPVVVMVVDPVELSPAADKIGTVNHELATLWGKEAESFDHAADHGLRDPATRAP